MAIIYRPTNSNESSTVICALCQQLIALAQATAGLRTVYGQQKFACATHSWSRREIINGWNVFAVFEQGLQAKQIKTKKHTKLTGMVGDVH